MPEKRALLLLSGGFDSPVAGKLLLDQGFQLEAVHFSLEPFTDAAAEEKAVALARHHGIARVHVVPAGPLFAAFTKQCKHAYYFVLTKRFMVRVADALADTLDVPFLATGENLAQVSSQTLTNMQSIDVVAKRPVIRPLVAYDKQEIVDLARAHGTFDLSAGPEVCDVMGPDHPVTSARVRDVDAEEARVDVTALVRTAMETMRVRDATAAASAPRA